MVIRQWSARILSGSKTGDKYSHTFVKFKGNDRYLIGNLVDSGITEPNINSTSRMYFNLSFRLELLMENQ